MQAAPATLVRHNAGRSIERTVYFGSGTEGDDMLCRFIEKIAPEADVMAFGADGEFKLKNDVVPPVDPTVHTLCDGRFVWVFEFPILPTTDRPFFLFLANRKKN